MMLPLKYFMPMLVVGFGGFTAATHWSAIEGYSSPGAIGNSRNVVSVSELPFPGYSSK